MSLTCFENDEVLLRELVLHGLEIANGGKIKWKSDNANHPRNWTWYRKTYDIGLIIFLDFFTTAASTAGTPVSEVARQEYKIGRLLAVFAFTSMYLLGQGIGGMLFPPYSESFGRKKLYISSTILYSLFCIVIAAVPSLVAVFVGRFICGFLSAIPTIVVAGSIEDLFDSGARAWMIYLWAMVANLGLITGSIMGTYIAHSIGWRWVFYVAAAVTGAISLLLLAIRESRPSQLLERYATMIRNATGDQTLRIQNPDYAPNISIFFRLAVSRPLRLLLTEPIVALVSILSAVAFGLIYLLIEAVQVVYESYGFTVQQRSLALIPLGIGFLFGVVMRLFDHRLLIKRRRAGQTVSPEDKLLGFVVAAPMLALGLWWFSWTIPPKAPGVPWPVSMGSLVFVGFAANEFDCTLAGYLADSYTLFAASAFAGLALLRATFSAGFPLFTPPMYTNLGPNVASSILATVATLFCLCPILFSRYGVRIRKASAFAKHSTILYNENRVGGEAMN